MIRKQVMVAFFSLCVLLLLTSMTIALNPGVSVREFTFVEMALPQMYIDSCYTYNAGGLVDSFSYDSGKKFVRDTFDITPRMTVSCLHKNKTTEELVPVEMFE